MTARAPETSSGVLANDRRFLAQMVPVQQQAVRLSVLARTRGASPEVRALAARIGRAQGGQVSSMRSCLDDWGSTGTTTAAHSLRTGPGLVAPGTMSDLQTGDLERRRGPAFDGRFLLLMQQHHRAALRRTGLELREGRDPRTRELARRMQRQMQGELVAMEGMARAGTRAR